MTATLHRYLLLLHNTCSSDCPAFTAFYCQRTRSASSRSMEAKVQRQLKRSWKVLGNDSADESKTATGKRVRPCSRAGCPASAPICFVRAVSTCCGNGYTSRWYHLSAGEHFCNDCFEYYYRCSKPGYPTYNDWKHIWSHNGQLDGGVNFFMMDQMLPFWAKCNICHKWRQLFRETQVTASLLKKYTCTKVLKNESQEDACSVEEDFRVEHLVRNDQLWVKLLLLKVLGYNALYAPCVRNYYMQAVGISPSDTAIHKFPDGITEVSEYLHPFQTVETSTPAMTVPPHHMTEEEIAEFPKFVSSLQSAYLLIRNTAIALWNMNVKKPVDRDRCINHIITRGMTRIWMYEQINHIIHFLTLRGFINTGLVCLPQELNFMEGVDQQHPVVVIGGGLAGLSAARHLTSLGVKTKLLEARGTLGGRAIDEGSPINAGAMILIGSHNNPVVILCKQANIPISEMGEHCTLLGEDGQPVNERLDRRMQFHFEAMLDINKQSHIEGHDVSLYDRFNELHQQFKEESGIKFSMSEECLLQFYMSNLEFACGSSLQNVSAKYWDQNEEYPQFSGPAVIIRSNLDTMVQKLAKGVDIETNVVVNDVDYSNNDILVKCSNGQEIKASKVIVSVPLSVLKDGSVKFTPSLPDNKTASLDCGHVEKVVLEFPEKFWAFKTTTGMFGQVVTETKSRGMMDVFYDMSISGSGSFLLVSYVTGEAVELMKTMTDKQMVDLCMKRLKDLFPDKTLPIPSKRFVTRWYKTEHINMSYSYMPVKAGPNTFDDLDKDVDQKIFFAGEATHKQFYQTLTGAYCSGLREAEKVFLAITK